METDSHFLVDPASGVVSGGSESDDSLQAAWTRFDAGAATPSLEFARLTISDGQGLRYRGTFTVATPSGTVIESVSGVVGVPEPTGAALAGLAACAASASAVRRRRRGTQAQAPVVAKLAAARYEFI